MEQRFSILLFFTGFFPLVLPVPRKYYLIQQGKTWSDAQAYCRATHTDLAVIQSNENLIQLQNEAHRQQFSSSAWVGLYNDVSSWRWSMGNEPAGTIQWSPGEPDNWHGHEECGALTPTTLGDGNCNELQSVVCFDDSYTGNQRDSWKWIDQTNFSTLSWMTGKPDNALKIENCGYLNNSQTADALCSDIMPSFCYTKINMRQQVVRVKVQSNEDVNDPAVKAAILEQINQKLKDRFSTEIITVKWRKQPDGVVFHMEEK
ncbi:C-type lectin domain-containing protein 180-like isoform X2 [Hemibagrus wyckioides]|uniref:C-type lectin domain-containing protein 180-like isoform X2 n=1 Tax=Hemibagrus wyckioides TaxID=337641 RepID=UPI00266D341E|nr:C-type lectin domain-containing protein 180-like isoform X2 [Hemibagrus wyckioides]